MLVLEKHNFRLQVRRFVIDLFDKRVMRSIVLDDDSSNESENTSPSDSRRPSAT
jgi:hypothetical protein